MGKDHNCTNYGGADGCSACMNDLRAELLDLKREHVALQDGHLDNMLHLVERTRERDTLLLQVRDLQNALDRDKTGLGAALAAIREEVKGRRWICEGRGPYTYDDDRYRQETGFAFNVIEKLAGDALAASGKLAHEALAVKRKDEGREVDVEITSREKGKPRIVED